MTQVFESYSNQRGYFIKKHSDYYNASPFKKSSPKSFNEKQQVKESRTFYPIPKGDSPYAMAKKSEYIEKDLSKAEYF